MKWSQGLISSKDACISDVNAFKTVEYWLNKTPIEKEKEPADLLPREPTEISSISIYGEDKFLGSGRMGQPITYKDLELIPWADQTGYIRFRFRIKKD